MKDDGHYQYDMTESGSAVYYSAARGYGFVTGENRRKISCLQVPETNTGFLPQWWHGEDVLTTILDTPLGVHFQPCNAIYADERPGRMLALAFRRDLPRAGCWRVKLTLAANKPVQEVVIFVGRRRLAWHGGLAAGETRTVSILCDVSSIIPRGQTEAICDPAINLAVLCGMEGGVSLNRIEIEAAQARTVYIMGDSTVTDQTANLPYAPGTSFGGWGQMIGAWLPEPLSVSNHAHSGLTTESFTEGGHWSVMAPLLHAGDICLIQFGHNDQKLPHLTARGGYSEWLHRYIVDIQARGAMPILVTPLARNSWTSDGRYNDLLLDYVAAVHQVGQETETPVIDLHAYSMELLCAEGLEQAKRWFYPGDYTHTNDFGAAKMGQYVAEQLCSLLKLTPINLPAWGCHPPFTALQPPTDCHLTPPSNGRADPLEPLHTQRPGDLLTRVEALELVIQLMRFFPLNVYNDLYTDVIGHETYAGTVQCAAQNDLIPAAWVTDGKLYPDQPVSLADFLAVLMPGYASRRALDTPVSIADNVPTYAQKAVGLAVHAGLVSNKEDWNAPLNRASAAALCQNIKL